MSTRIYLITMNLANEKANVIIKYLVRAKTRTQAMRHVAAKLMDCEVASQEDLIDLISSVEIEDAVLDPDQLKLSLEDKAA